MNKKESKIKGLDVGTAFIYSVEKLGPKLSFKSVRNCFFDVEYSKFAEDVLKKHGAAYFKRENKLYLLGEDAIRFANFFGKSTRRSLRNGIISPREEEAISVAELLLGEILGRAGSKDETVYFSIPASPVDANFDVGYHKDIVERLIKNLGYKAKPLNEGLAVVYSELKDSEFTGIGISIGGGMTNVCFASMAIPILSFSIVRAGDWIDSEVARVTNEPESKITSIKESELNLNLAKQSSEKNKQALFIYYSHLIDYILEKIKEVIEGHPGLIFEREIPIAITGGTSSPKGFLAMFKEGLKKISLPIKIGEINVAAEPLLSVVKGTLEAGISDFEYAQ